MVDTALSFAGEFIPGIETATKIIERVVELKNTVKSEFEKRNGKDSPLYYQIAIEDSKKLINDYLHEYFIYDAYEVMRKRERPLVIMLDGYERYVNVFEDVELVKGKDDWIHAIDKRLVNIPNTLWVVVGREQINWKEDVLPADNQHLIGNLSKSDTVEYFRKAGIKEENLISHLYRVCNGTPVYMDICVENYREIKAKRIPVIGDFGQDTNKLAHRFLGNIRDKATRRLLEMIAWLPNVWDEDMVIEIAKKIGYESYLPDFAIIKNLSIIEPIDNGFKMHETCRVAARDVCEEKEKIQKAIAEYFKDRFSDEESNIDIGLINQMIEEYSTFDSVMNYSQVSRHDY